MAYLDTSVLAAYYCPERLSEAVGRVLRDISTPTISSLVEIELCSAVALKVRTRELGLSSAGAIISRLQVDITGNLYKIVDIGPREFRLARDWSGRFSSPLRTLDALHLAAAFSNDLELITTDKALKAAAHFPCQIAWFGSDRLPLRTPNSTGSSPPGRPDTRRRRG